MLVDVMLIKKTCREAFSFELEHFSHYLKKLPNFGVKYSLK